MTHVPIRRALLSVSDKTGLVDLARALDAAGVELVSTGGTAAAIRREGLPVRDVAEVTGHAEIMGGRVKTLHPRVHGGLLSRTGLDDAEAETNGIEPIDLLVLNLYPFEETVASGADDAAVIEQIDIGGPAMLRSAAKNHARVTVAVSPDDYGALIEAVRVGGPDLAMRRRLAAKAFARVSAYDAAIDAWFAGREAAGWGEGGRAPAALPDALAITAPLIMRTRYGENPHQAAALYADGSAGGSEGGSAGVAAMEPAQGKALSYNNLNDADAAWELAGELAATDERAAVVIVKHANPCGVALGGTVAEAHARALACDPVSAFGGIVAVTRPLTRADAEAITAVFTEVVIAPDADEGARAVFAAKPSLRLLLGPLPDPRRTGRMVRSIGGGLLVQERDAMTVAELDLSVATKRAPDDAQRADLMLAWTVAKHVKSNAIVYVRDGMTVGIGAGQMSRIDSARIAARKAEDAREALAGGDAPGGDAPAGASTLGIDVSRPLTAGSAVASDAFFPFADGLLAAAGAGATSVIQPGGSKRDRQVVAAADEAGLAMLLTGVRHFRH